MGTSRNLRIGFGILAIIALIEILQTQVVLNAVLLFSAAGIIPGTNIALSPEATMWSLGGVLIASILLIFHKEIIIACMPAARIELEEQLPQPAVVTELEAKPGEHRPRATSRVFAGMLHMVRALPVQRRVSLSQYRVRFFKMYAIAVVRLGSFGAELRPVLIATLARSRVLGRRGWIIGQRTFRLVHSKLAAFDRWATAKIQQREDLAELQKWLRMATKVLVDWTAQARNLLVNLSRKFNR